MTLSLRNTLIKVILTVFIIFFLFYFITILFLTRDNSFSLIQIETILRGMPDSFKSSSISYTLVWTIITASVLFGFSLITSLLLFHYFKKKISPEIFFFVLFIISLSLQSVRLFQFQLLILHVSPFFGVIVTRVFYFFRFFGVFCFFASSLFPIGIKFQKFGTILLSIFLLSFTISALMPIDLTDMNRYFLYNISDRTSLLIIILSVRVLTIINFIRVAITTKSRNYILVLIASILIIAGDELLLILPIPLVAFSMILSGTVLYSRSIYNYYLWI